MKYHCNEIIGDFGSQVQKYKYLISLRGTSKDLVASADTGADLVVLRFGVAGGVEVGLDAVVDNQ